MVPPFKGNFVGMVVDVREPEISRRGLPQQTFDLVDESGTWFTCCAVGRCATSPALKNGYQIVLYSGTGRPKTSLATAAVYLFKDAVVVPLYQRTTYAQKQIHLEMFGG